MQDIAYELNISIDAVCYFMRRYRLTRRTVSENEAIKFERKPRRAGDQSRTAAVIEKARKILGYNPSTSLAEGLKATGNWFTEKVLPLIKENKL